MSKFIEMVVSNFTQREYLKPGRLSTSVKDITTKDFINIEKLKEYEIGVNWKVRVRCEEKVLDEIMKDVIERLRMDVYGDFEEKLFELEIALYEYNFEKAIEIFRGILKEVRDG